MPETKPTSTPNRHHRQSFRENVLHRIRHAGIRGITHEAVLEYFAGEPRVKVTVALNELLGRREAYLRSGIYRATTYPKKD
jgi:hypothetical protein